MTASISFSGTRTTAPRCASASSASVDVGVVGVRAGAEPRDALVDDGRRVRHRAADRNAGGEVPLDRRGRDRGGDGEDRLVVDDQVADLAEKRLDVLRLDRDHDERGARYRLLIRERGRDAVALAELGHALGAAARGDDVRRQAPARREQPGDERLADLPGAEYGDASLVHCHAAV